MIAKGSKPAVRLVAIPQSGFRIGDLRRSAAAFPTSLSRWRQTISTVGKASELASVLLDTHAWAWSFAAPSLISPAARAAIVAADAVYVSPISFFEIGQKVRLGKWPEIAEAAPRLAELLREQRGVVAPLHRRSPSPLALANGRIAIHSIG